MPGKLSDEDKEELENEAKKEQGEGERKMDYKEYRENRELLEKRMEEDDKTIHDMERRVDFDREHGDREAENVDRQRMKDAEKDFDQASEEMKQLDDRWKEQNKEKEEERTR